MPESEQEFSENWIFKGDLIARILLRDQIRLGSESTLLALKAKEIKSVMLTGDRRSAAESVGKKIEIGHGHVNGRRRDPGLDSAEHWCLRSRG